MEKLFYIIIAVLISIWIIIEVFTLITRQFPPLDREIKLMLIRSANSYIGKMKDEDGEFLYTNLWNGVHIYKQNYSLLFPYWLEGVGVVPFWYESKKELDKLWEDFPSVREQERNKKLNF